MSRVVRRIQPTPIIMAVWASLAAPSAFAQQAPDAGQTLRLSPVDEQGVNSAALQISDAILSSLALGVLGAVHAAAVAQGGATSGTYDAMWWGAAAVALAAAVLAARMKPVSAVPVGSRS